VTPSRSRTLTIDGFAINDTSDCYVIAEIGHNHQGDLEQAKRMFTAAHECGAHAVKLQKRDNRTLYTRDFFNRPYDNESSFGATYGEHREALELGRDEYVELQRHAASLGLAFFATAFDFASADFLADIDVPAYKIASGDLTNTPLLRYVGEIGKPVVFSTGGGTLEDVRRAYETLAEVNSEVAVLQCTAGYPAAWDELDLRVIGTYRELFPDAVIGFSSHDNGIAMPVAAYVLGARLVEKHFTLNRAMKGTDHAFSLEPQGMRKMVRDLRRTRLALGDSMKKMYQSEAAPIVKMGKKLVAAREFPSGHVLAREDIALRSPGDGVPPYELERFVGRTLRHPVAEEMALTFELLEEVVPELMEEALSGSSDDR
jgi:N-acetylneuraminate synthase/sialic acid synthase